MEFNKNTDLIQDVCLVQIKSVDNVVDIPNLTTVYHTPSKIRLTGNSKPTDAGIVSSVKLSLSYPGISSADFSKFHDLTRGAYEVFIKTTTNDVYEVSSVRMFMTLESSFDIKSGHTLVFTSKSPFPIKFRETQPEEGISIVGFDYDFDFYLE